MSITKACPISGSTYSDPRFQKVKEYYADRHFSDKRLADAIQLCRELHGYNDEWYPIEPSQKGVFTRFLNSGLLKMMSKRTDSNLQADDVFRVYSLMYSVYTPEQLESRLDMLAHDFREMVDSLIEEHPTKLTRQEWIKSMGNDKTNGYQYIMKQVFDMYEDLYTDIDKIMQEFDSRKPYATPEQRENYRKKMEYRATEYKTILANKERLAALAAAKIGNDEGFVVTIDNFEVSFQEFNEDDFSTQNMDSEETDGEDKAESVKGERFVDFRTVKLLESLSPRARKMMSQIVKVNRKGEVVRDDLGCERYVGARQAAIVLNRILVPSTDKTMMDDILTASEQYPWLKGLHEYLESNPDEQATVWCNFKKADTMYIYGDFEKGQYNLHIANSRSAGNALMQEAGVNLQGGYELGTPGANITTGYGALKSKDFISNLRASFKKNVMDVTQNGDTGVMRINMVGEKADPVKMREWVGNNDEIIELVTDALRGLGFVVTENDIRTIANQSMSDRNFGFLVGFKEARQSNKGKNKLYQLIEAIDDVYAAAERVLRSSEPHTGLYLFNTAGTEFRKINSCLALSQYKEVESRVNSENKSLSAYNNVNLLHQVIDFLKNRRGLTDEQYADEIDSEYLQFEGMAVGKDKIVGGWLEYFINNNFHGTQIRDMLQLFSMSAFNHVEYAQMTRQQKLTSSVIAFFNASETLGRDVPFAGYENLIQGDYDTAHDYIFAPKLFTDKRIVENEDGSVEYVDCKLVDSELVDALAHEVLCEVDRIRSIEQRACKQIVNKEGELVDNPNYDPNRAILTVRERQGMKFQIFPEFNDNNFRQRLVQFINPDDALAFVKSQITEQLEKVVEKDRETIQSSGILTNKAMKYLGPKGKKVSIYSKDNDINQLNDEANQALRDFFLNVFYARTQMLKLIVGGMEQFNGLIDFEKRNMMEHATHTSLYTKATWKGKPVMQRDHQNVAYLVDEEGQSRFIDKIDKLLKSLIKSDDNPTGIISERQYESMIRAYKSIKSTDGQGFRSLDSYRAFKIMAAEWTDDLEISYNNIKNGSIKEGDLDVFLQPIKPVTTGYEIVPAAKGDNQKPVKLTVLHKYSEICLLPTALAEYCIHAQSVPVQAVAAAQELLKGQNEVDLFLFTSGAKVGAFSALDPFQKVDDKGKKVKGGKDGHRVNKTKDEITNYIVSGITSDRFAIHHIPWKYTGIAAATPVHKGATKIARASQLEKQAWANIRPRDKVMVGGKPMDALKARDLYYAIKTASIVTSYNEIRDYFSNPDELEKVFREELADKQYTSSELPFALKRLADGSFALPLFSPNVQHDVQQLLASIIKKRMTKRKTKGENILVSTALGLEHEFDEFSEEGIPNSWKLGPVFDKAGNFKYMEVGMPLNDERLKQFANENGEITPDMLNPENKNSLVARGIIPEELLYIVASRTPSDAEHSAVPCRIKWFSSNLAGARMVMPKEAMVMTGQDFDGDKMRVDFKDFTIGWDDAQIRKMYNEHRAAFEKEQGMYKSLFRQMFGKTDVPEDWYKSDQYVNYTTFKSWVTSENNPRRDDIRRVVTLPKFDYESVFEKQEDGSVKINSEALFANSQQALDNALVELMFSELSSPACSKRVLIPGGCDETKIYAKSIYLVHLAESNPTIKRKIYEQLNEMGRRPAGTTLALYKSLSSMYEDELTSILREISGSETPFTLSHALDAFEYIMGGAEMIGIYAKISSSHAMLQRLNMHYIPKTIQDEKSGNTYTVDVKLFDRDFNTLFDVENQAGLLSLLSLARLVNAAVDNNKDPVLGYLNQTKQMAEITSLLLAAGLTEENVHLFMNQPAVLELINRLKGRSSESINAVATEIIDEMKARVAGVQEVRDLGQYGGVRRAGEMKQDAYIKNLKYSYKDILAAQNPNMIMQQASLLFTIIHLQPAATQLGKFINLVRPESESGAIGSSIADIIAKMLTLQNFRTFIEDTDNLRISGMEQVLAPIEIAGGERNYLMSELGSDLSEVRALNSLMVEGSLEMFLAYFPQARSSWWKLAKTIAEDYKYRTLQEGTMHRVLQEQILWKLLSDRAFITGNPEVEQKRVIVDVPFNLKTIKDRINKAEKNKDKELTEGEVRDTAAEQLIGNAFLEKLTTWITDDSEVNPRIQFTMNGAVIEGQTDTIRAGWNQLLQSSDASIRQLAIDLFKYNLYTNGFNYGMYEFSHFAPFSVLISTPGYLEALNKILFSDFSDIRDNNNFLHYYYMNHWGDKRFLDFRSDEIMGEEAQVDENGKKFYFIPAAKLPEYKALFKATPDGNVRMVRYIVLLSNAGEDAPKIQTLYRIDSDDNGNVFLREAPKLGVVNYHGQSTLQYNPTVDYDKAKPVVPGNDSAWGYLDNDIDPYAEANIESGSVPVSMQVDDNYLDEMIRQKFGGVKKEKKVQEELQRKSESAAEQNGDIPPQAPLDAIEEPVSNTADTISPDELDAVDAAFNAQFGVKPKGKKLLSIARVTEDGDVVVDKVEATPNNIRRARKQQVYVALNKKLREILHDKGVAIGALTETEARMAIGGVTDFDTATVTAEGLLEMIRLANGWEGEYALPEEFAHLGLAMIGGKEHPLVSRLYTALENSDEAMQEAYGDQYQQYQEKYNNDRDMLIEEAAGKLVAKHLFLEQEIQSSPVRRLIHRITDAIKSFLRRFSKDEVQNAIFDANQIASKVARGMLGGRLLDEGSLESIHSSKQFYQISTDLTDKDDILSKMLKTEVKKYNVYKTRISALGDNAQEDPEVIFVKNEIDRLEKAIQNHKVEEAIISYMHNALTFLGQTDDSLNDSLNSGQPANIICKKLNILRDTLFSYAQSLEDVQQAIVSREITDTVALSNAIDSVSGLLNKFMKKYQRVAGEYFEKMLSGVYGDMGIKVTIGRDRGRVISIHEMATMADRDISLMQRWFYSLADCNDYVLRAIDDIARNAKMEARNRTLALKPKLEHAVNELVRATGSRDQTFMFEYITKAEYIERERAKKFSETEGNFDEINENDLPDEWKNEKDMNRKHKTGKYISKDSEAYNNLSDAQKAFYNTIMEIKAEADECVPDTFLEEGKIVMLRKYTADRVKEAKGVKNKAYEAWEGVKNDVLDTSDDVNFDDDVVSVDFEGNRIDKLIPMYLLKGKNETYDDMTDDVALSVMAYADMAFEYNQMSNVVAILENARYMSADRQVVQHTGTGRKVQREYVGGHGKDSSADEFFYKKAFTVKQARTRMQEALDDYFTMHIYNHVQADEGTFGDTRISKRKVTNLISRIVSLSQMAINIPQRIANVNTGLSQIIIETAGKGKLNIKDVHWGHKIYLRESADRLAETGKTDYDNKLSLFLDRYDIHQDNGRNWKMTRYSKGRMSRVFNSGLLYAGLTIGEDYLSSVTALAAARNFKMIDDKGQPSNLWDALEVRYVDDTKKSGAYLAVKDGYKKADGTELTKEDEREYQKAVIGMNFELQGIYNLDDRSAIQQHTFGALIIMYRKWIAPAIKRRYQGIISNKASYSLLKGDFEEGYHTTMLHLLVDSVKDGIKQVSEDESIEACNRIISDVKAVISSVKLNYDKLTDYEKSNVMRSLTELSIVFSLFVASFLLAKLPPNDHDGNKYLTWADNFMVSQILRLRTELGSQAPTPMFIGEGLKILNSPFAAIGPIRDSLKIFQLMIPTNYTTEIRSGRYKGHSKAYKYFRELPIISMFKKVDNFLDPSPLINYYKNDAL